MVFITEGLYIYILYYVSIFYYFRQYLNEEPCKWMCQIKLINTNTNNNNNNNKKGEKADIEYRLI